MTERAGLIQKFLSRFLASRSEARALQLSGILRFFIILAQGIILVKAGVDLTTVGQIEFILFVVNFLSYFFLGGGRNAMLSYRKDSAVRLDNTNLVSAAFYTFHLFGVIGCLLLTITMLLPGEGVLGLLTFDFAWPYLFLFLFFGIASGPMEYAYLIRGQLRRMIWTGAIFQGFQLIAVTLPLVFAQDLALGIAALAGVTGLRWLFTIIDLKWIKIAELKIAHIGIFLGFAFPLVLHSLMGGIMDYVDNWLVSWFYGDAQFAVYRYGARELPVNMLLIGGLAGGLIHSFRSEGAISVADLKVEMNRLMDILFPLTSLLIILSPLLYVLFYSGDFKLSARIFNIYAFTLVARIVINQVVLYHYQKNWLLFAAAAGEVIVNIVLSILLMQSMGILGIPLATVIAYILHRICLSAYVSVKYGYKLKDYLSVTRFTAYTVLMLFCFLISEWLHFK